MHWPTHPRSRRVYVRHVGPLCSVLGSEPNLDILNPQDAQGWLTYYHERGPTRSIRSSVDRGRAIREVAIQLSPVITAPRRILHCNWPQGVSANKSEAIRLYELAARQGFELEAKQRAVEALARLSNTLRQFASARTGALLTFR
jgi:hypothetical protein